MVVHTNWTGASNNLAVTYRQLGLKANVYILFKNVADKYPLAKSNLAEIFASSGALSEAEELAKSVLSISEHGHDIQLAMDRARYVLSEIESTKKTEKEIIDRLGFCPIGIRSSECFRAESAADHIQTRRETGGRDGKFIQLQR